MDQAVPQQRICITGAAGFIGSHLTEMLLAAGQKVTGIDNFNDFYSPSIKRRNLRNALANKNFTLAEADIRSTEDMKEALKDSKALIHLAAMAGVRPSMENPALYQDVNIGGTLNLLETCKNQGIKNIIFGSSSSIYGNNPKVPFSEQDPVDHPISVYAATKKAGELLCHTYHEIYDLDITCLRFFTVYGPRQRPDLAIHKFASLILEEKPIPLFGDGSMERDYTHVTDITEGLLSALVTNPGAGFRIINLGNDRPIRLDTLVSLLESALGKKAIIHRQPVPSCDVPRTWADLKKARRELAYHPKVNIKQGVTEFTRWLKKDHASQIPLDEPTQTPYHQRSESKHP